MEQQYRDLIKADFMIQFGWFGDPSKSDSNQPQTDKKNPENNCSSTEPSRKKTSKHSHKTR